MEVKPTTSFFGGTEKFKIGNITVKADTGSAKVIQENDGAIKIIGGKNVRLKNGSKFDLDYETTNNGNGTKISFLDSEISSVIATQGKSRIHFENCRFHDSSEEKICFGLINSGKKSEVIIGGENNAVTVNGDLKGYLSCYSMGDNDASRKDNIIINGNNYAEIAAGIKDEINIKGNDYNERSFRRINDNTVQDIIFNRNYKMASSMAFCPMNSDMGLGRQPFNTFFK